MNNRVRYHLKADRGVARPYSLSGLIYRKKSKISRFLYERIPEGWVGRLFPGGVEVGT